MFIKNIISRIDYSDMIFFGMENQKTPKKNSTSKNDIFKIKILTGLIIVLTLSLVTMITLLILEKSNDLFVLILFIIDLIVTLCFPFIYIFLPKVANDEINKQNKKNLANIINII